VAGHSLVLNDEVHGVVGVSCWLRVVVWSSNSWVETGISIEHYLKKIKYK